MPAQPLPSSGIEMLGPKPLYTYILFDINNLGWCKVGYTDDPSIDMRRLAATTMLGPGVYLAGWLAGNVENAVLEFLSKIAKRRAKRGVAGNEVVVRNEAVTKFVIEHMHRPSEPRTYSLESKVIKVFDILNEEPPTMDVRPTDLGAVPHVRVRHQPEAEAIPERPVSQSNLGGIPKGRLATISKTAEEIVDQPLTPSPRL